MKLHKILQDITAAAPSAAMLLPAMGSAFAAQPTLTAERLGGYTTLKAAYLDSDDMPAELFPHGAVSIAQGSTDMQMNKLYEIDLFRQGGTAGKASVTLSTIDLTAAYGKDYELRLNSDLSQPAEKGEASLYFARTGLPYIPVETESEQAITDDQTAEEMMQSFIDTNDNAADSLPHSSDVTLNFADGENHKTVYVRTFKPEYATADASSLTNETKLTDLNGLEASISSRTRLSENSSDCFGKRNGSIFCSFSCSLQSCLFCTLLFAIRIKVDNV